MYKASNLATPEDIHLTISEIHKFIGSEYNADNASVVVERANMIEQYMAISGKMLADAKYHLSEFLNTEFIASMRKAMQVSMSVSLTNKYIDSSCRDLQYLVDFSERTNRACTHQLEFARTIISKLKAEYAASHFNG